MSDTFQRVYDNAVEVAALERAQAIINIEWKLVEEKRLNFLEYISKNFSPKVIFYDDDPTNPADGEIHGLTLMTRKINEQVKTLGSIIVDFREKDALHKTMSMNMADALVAHTQVMNEILEKVSQLEERMSASIPEQSKSPYQLYYPQSDTDTETSDTVSKTLSTSPGISYTTCPTRPVIRIRKSSPLPKMKSKIGGYIASRAGKMRGQREEDKTPATPQYFPKMMTVDRSDQQPGPSTSEDFSTTSPSSTILEMGDEEPLVEELGEPYHRPLATTSLGYRASPRRAGAFLQDYSNADCCPEVDTRAPAMMIRPRYASRRGSFDPFSTSPIGSDPNLCLDSFDELSISPLETFTPPHMRAARRASVSQPDLTSTPPSRSGRMASTEPRTSSMSSRRGPQRRPSRFRKHW